MLTFLRVVLSFAIVGVVLYAFVRVSAGRLGTLLGGSQLGRHAALEILERRQLTRSSTVVLLRAGDEHLLLGVGDAGVTLLTEGNHLAKAGAPTPAEEGATRTRAGILLGREIEEDAVGTVDGETQRNEHEYAWTRLEETPASRPTRMNLLAALREMTVRRS